MKPGNKMDSKAGNKMDSKAVRMQEDNWIREDKWVGWADNIGWAGMQVDRDRYTGRDEYR
jgi:hypothetical protein